MYMFLLVIFLCRTKWSWQTSQLVAYSGGICVWAWCMCGLQLRWRAANIQKKKKKGGWVEGGLNFSHSSNKVRTKQHLLDIKTVVVVVVLLFRVNQSILGHWATSVLVFWPATNTLAGICLHQTNLFKQTHLWLWTLPTKLLLPTIIQTLEFSVL